MTVPVNIEIWFSIRNMPAYLSCGVFDCRSNAVQEDQPLSATQDYYSVQPTLNYPPYLEAIIIYHGQQTKNKNISTPTPASQASLGGATVCRYRWQEQRLCHHRSSKPCNVSFGTHTLKVMPFLGSAFRPELKNKKSSKRLGSALLSSRLQKHLCHTFCADLQPDEHILFYVFWYVEKSFWRIVGCAERNTSEANAVVGRGISTV